ncbi:MAG: MmcQ/YjbR family DNA-binding protein [Thermoanaerobaculia bacterium]|nr:MmcQ/YjbR family DNA-binding protein [Thermoanaerobaculia bacterium]
MSEHFSNPVTSALRAYATTFPEVSEGASCVNRAFKARKKNFLFVGEKDDGSCKVMLKLGPSLADAVELSRVDSRVEAGKSGWATIRFGASEPPDLALLKRWVDESYRLLAPKSLVKLL